MESSWWQRLEQELEQQFDRFLSDHPNQKELLDQEHWNEQQRRKQQRLIDIDQEAQQLRQQLLKLSQDISAWSERARDQAQRPGPEVRGAQVQALEARGARAEQRHLAQRPCGGFLGLVVVLSSE